MPVCFPSPQTHPFLDQIHHTDDDSDLFDLVSRHQPQTTPLDHELLLAAAHDLRDHLREAVGIADLLRQQVRPDGSNHHVTLLMQTGNQGSEVADHDDEDRFTVISNEDLASLCELSDASGDYSDEESEVEFNIAGDYQGERYRANVQTLDYLLERHPGQDVLVTFFNRLQRPCKACRVHGVPCIPEPGKNRCSRCWKEGNRCSHVDRLIIQLLARFLRIKKQHSRNHFYYYHHARSTPPTRTRRGRIGPLDRCTPQSRTTSHPRVQTEKRNRRPTEKARERSKVLAGKKKHKEKDVRTEYTAKRAPRSIGPVPSPSMSRHALSLLCSPTPTAPGSPDKTDPQLDLTPVSQFLPGIDTPHSPSPSSTPIGSPDPDL